MSIRFRVPSSGVTAAVLLGLFAAGCAHNDLEAVGETVGQRVTRTACPAVAIPAYTGDVTLFDPPASRAASAIDVVATITDLRTSCDEATATGEKLNATVSFTVLGRRTNAAQARDVTLPYFASVMRGGTVIESKQMSQVTLHFDAGQTRAQASGRASAQISRAAATLPADVLGRVNRKRKATDADASVDPMSDPAVKAALARASFELLVGFQLSNDQLAYNATR